MKFVPLLTNNGRLSLLNDILSTARDTECFGPSRDVISLRTIRNIILYFLLVVHWNRASTSLR